MKNWTSKNDKNAAENEFQNVWDVLLHLVMLCTIFYMFFSVEFNVAKIKSIISCSENPKNHFYSISGRFLPKRTQNQNRQSTD